MWPFNARRNLERKRITEVFAQYLSPEMVDRLATNPEKLELGLTPARIHFLLAQVRDDDVPAVQGFLGRAVDIIMDCKGLVESFPSPFAVGWFGAPLPGIAQAQARTDRAAAVARLLAELGANVKIVTGDRDGLYGNIGSERRFNFGFVVPGFGECLAALQRLSYGEARET